ncbi:hypothetical protein [Burkholderia pyrrocinia]
MGLFNGIKKSAKNFENAARDAGKSVEHAARDVKDVAVEGWHAPDVAAARHAVEGAVQDLVNKLVHDSSAISPSLHGSGSSSLGGEQQSVNISLAPQQ